MVRLAHQPSEWGHGWLALWRSQKLETSFAISKVLVPFNPILNSIHSVPEIQYTDKCIYILLSLE